MKFSGIKILCNLDPATKSKDNKRKEIMPFFVSLYLKKSVLICSVKNYLLGKKENCSLK